MRPSVPVPAEHPIAITLPDPMSGGTGNAIGVHGTTSRRPIGGRSHGGDLRAVP